MISIKDIINAWNRFFFEPISPVPVAVYRILLGLVLILNHALLFPDVGNWFTDEGTLSFAAARRLAGGVGLNLFNWLPQTNATVWTIYLLSFLAAITMTLGLFTRTSTIIMYLTLITLHHRNPLVLNSGDTFLRIATFFMMFAPAGAALSLDRLLRIARGKESGEPAPRAPWAQRLIQWQLAFVYIYAFVWKAMGSMWLSGTAVYYTSRIPEFWRFPVPYVFEHVWTIKLWSWMTLIIELALGTLVWIKEFRYWVLLAGVLLHLGIDYSMNIPLFGYIMMGAYVLFVPPEDMERAFAWARAKFNRATRFQEPIPVLYDGKCSFCIRTLEVVRRLDIFDRLKFFAMHEPSTKDAFPDFDAKRGETEMLVRTKDGWLGGFFAFRYIARHLPLLWPILPFLFLSPIRKTGDRLYQRIAARRYCLVSSGH
ncbi:MAG TPA: HTTM domain-containing protein [Verrucomicrobiae bacterium]